MGLSKKGRPQESPTGDPCVSQSEKSVATYVYRRTVDRSVRKRISCEGEITHIDFYGLVDGHLKTYKRLEAQEGSGGSQ